ncbi:hypothetical protein IU501_21040 [Nocardia otitidiscaviarum]|uniref:hypothetical protein n=1 Tax=Nocardia otitidiscaviarum TaxID=1823 RepID=UPI0004A775C3|nr:hypothetical protein [Nocardia otitidiscaviarum]MBF6135475.1 hypothetical protein [Nocardia otitidiscaviarum]MBF6487292.1 hypothetical protein [Nocardia otitidiscaviarum]
MGDGDGESTAVGAGRQIDEQWLAAAQDALGTARRPAELLLEDRERALRHAAHTYASGHTNFDAIASGGGGLATTLVIEAAFLALPRR